MRLELAGEHIYRLMAELAYRLRADREHGYSYRQAVEDGRIPPIKRFSMDLLAQAVDELPDGAKDRYFFMVPTAGDLTRPILEPDDEQGNEK